MIFGLAWHRRIRRIFRGDLLKESAEFTIKEFARIFATPDPHEGMSAFLEKRAPQFGGQ